MSLSLADLDQIMKLFDQSNFSELKLEAGDLKLHLRKPGGAAGNCTDTGNNASDFVITSATVIRASR